MAIKNTPTEIRWNPEQPISEVTQTSDLTVSPEVIEEIADLRAQIGKDLVMLGHHYQRDEVIQFADKRGDSLALSQYAAKVEEAKYVMFLGVHFMAETADMLTPKDVKVILPDKRAGCTMADMADIDDIEDAWEQISAFYDTSKIIPVTYINSTADVKAFVGEHGGTICTSANARKIIEWALSIGEKLFFFPDQHLGRNTCFDLGIPLDDMIVWDPEEPLGGHDQASVKDSRILLWRGHCSVHQHFVPEHADSWRKRIPDIKIIVHPECSFEVVQKADYSGSTGGILKTIREAPEGSKWAVGTENNLVNRLGNEMVEQGKEVYSLAPYACLCSTMFRISPEALRESLKALTQDEYKWLITVPDQIRNLSNLALERMFKITG
ncbi:MAG TPA: quinolinate synthase NadA [Bacteroidetes bacterium]|nr:quinolinate synthase A [bacterium BMS3Bbin04]HDO65800.1 quinolinate synthase NadA [Bacteroidota bacterium]HEX04925.1 quinolinate synthase NadA [Bacteroidota bacterium]